MVKLKLPLILASGSPRRKEILTTMGIEYTVDVPDVDETTLGSPREMVLELSLRKANAVAQRHGAALILAADTLVYGHGQVLGKPISADEAKSMLRALCGQWHDVYTGMTLINTESGKTLQRADRTRVHFIELTDAQIDAYVATGEPMDKAGAYGIQGMAGMYIDRIEGSYSNVVGLPMAALFEMIKEMNES